MSFCLCFVTKRDFDCEQVEQQTSQTELTQCLSCSTFRNHAFRTPAHGQGNCWGTGDLLGGVV